jgi:hypothetical protein
VVVVGFVALSRLVGWLFFDGLSASQNFHPAPESASVAFSVES